LASFLKTRAAINGSGTYFSKGVDRLNKSRPNPVLFRLNDPEKEQFRDKVARSGLTQQDYIRKCVLDKPVISLDRAELHKIMVELSRQGNNLNQITRVLNERGDLAHENEISEMKGELEKTWQQLRQLIHTLA